MIKLLSLFVVVMFLAFMSHQMTDNCNRANCKYRIIDDYSYLLMLVIMIFFAGLRTSYNDTWNYMDGFIKAPGIKEYMSSPDAYNIFKNPLFYFFQSFLRSLTDNPQWLVFLTSAFTQVCFLKFFKRYSTNFTFTIFLYFTYGTFCFSLAAIKQVLGMAVVTLAIPYLEKRKWIRYYFLIFIAMLVHTYSIMFAIMPLFSGRPWKLFTFLLIIIMAVVLSNFREVIENFMEQANEFGKTLADYEVFSENTINILRLMVYAVTPMISLIFQKWLFPATSNRLYILVNMSILSLAFMTMGTQAGANMFARMATYFELGTICALPSMLERIFEKKSYRMVSTLACVLFFIYFVYSFGINIKFDEALTLAPIWRLFKR